MPGVKEACGIAHTLLRLRIHSQLLLEVSRFYYTYTFDYLVDVSDIFYFFCSGRGKGESEEKGSVFNGKFQEGCVPGGGGAGRGREGPGGCLRRIGDWGGGK